MNAQHNGFLEMNGSKGRLIEWLVSAGILAQMKALREEAEQQHRLEPWRSYSMAIIRFTIPDHVIAGFVVHGRRPCGREACWQGGQLSISCDYFELLSEREVLHLLGDH